jgi:hypothetical protein
VARRYITGFWAPEEVMAFDDGAGRDLDVVCTLREYHKPAWPKARENAVRWLEEINLPHKVLGEVSDWQEGNRDRTEPRYFDAMRRAKIGASPRLPCAPRLHRPHSMLILRWSLALAAAQW